jgi:pyruvate formate lyase activating enzyme
MKVSARPDSHPPLILEIKGNSLDDGPGIRSVVFFKGCPLACLWCHNPESKRPEVELGHDADVCIGCGTCEAACPKQALGPDHPFFIDRAQCDLCFDCTEACPTGALRRIGSAMTIAQIVAAVSRDKPFYASSGGGVTLSGGEPTLAMAFAAELAAALQKTGIHILLETCGAFALQTFKQVLYPFVDQIYFDLKLMDDNAHQRFCGASNRIIIENFRQLQRGALAGGVPILPRVPLIPGITDTPANLQATAAFLKQCGAGRVQLLPYHPLWQAKNRTIGLSPPVHGHAQALGKWLPAEALSAGAAVFSREGISVAS